MDCQSEQASWVLTRSDALARPGVRTFPFIHTSARGLWETTGEHRRRFGEFLSESSFILGLGLTTVPWHGITGWAEAGFAMSYVTGHMLPDYRGGVSMGRNFGRGSDG
jgi:hypothetical protein